MAPTNYAAFIKTGESRSRIGHLDFESETITPLSFASGTPLSNLYEVIEAGEQIVISSGDQHKLAEVKLLPPISGRDVLAVGKNYSEHAKEFNASG